jgi:hypothetical protein
MVRATAYGVAGVCSSAIHPVIARFAKRFNCVCLQAVSRTRTPGDIAIVRRRVCAGCACRIIAVVEHLVAGVVALEARGTRITHVYIAVTQTIAVIQTIAVQPVVASANERRGLGADAGTTIPKCAQAIRAPAIGRVF